MIEFHRFLISLSVLCDMYNSEICAHFVPISCTLSQMSMSSCTDHSPLLSCGRRWLRHRSRHCLPFRLVRFVAIWAHDFIPNWSTRLRSCSSSSGFHGRRLAFGAPSSSSRSGSSYSSASSRELLSADRFEAVRSMGRLGLRWRRREPEAPLCCSTQRARAHPKHQW